MAASRHPLQLSPNRLEFADSRIEESLQICFQNTSSKTSCFKIRLPAIAAGNFTVKPVTGSIKAGGKEKVEVKYTPDGRIVKATKLQVKYLQLEEGMSYRTEVFVEKKELVKTILLPVTFLDTENDTDDMFKTPKTSHESSAPTGQWWKR